MSCVAMPPSSGAVSPYNPCQRLVEPDDATGRAGLQRSVGYTVPL